MRYRQFADAPTRRTATRFTLVCVLPPSAKASPHKKNAVRIRTASTSWRRRESNPRPNKEPQGFLHVYSALDPLARDGRRRPDPLPQSLKSHTATETHAALSLN